MKRKASKFLNEWLHRSHRKPLVIRGARQTGKSTLVRMFAKENNLNLIEINFEENSDYKLIFNTNNVDQILQSLEIKLGKRINYKNSLLFLDEIQAHPKAFQALRYFYENKKALAVCAAGSLLDFLLNDHEFSMPVGRIEYLFLGPMTFEEFLWASKADTLYEFLSSYVVDKKNTFNQSIHQSALSFLRNYLVLGGMPEVIKTYIEDKSFLSADIVKQSIINTYRDDFNKYKKRLNTERIQKVFNKFPQLVGKKIIYSHIDKNDRAKEIENALCLLEQAKIIYRVCHSSGNGIPLGAEINEKFKKGLFLDVGLLCSLNGLSFSDLNSELMLINNGLIAEQFIGQHLLYLNDFYQLPELYYWIREKSQSNAEIDYLQNIGSKVIPVEVKAGSTGKLRSLHVFMQLKKLNFAVRFNTDLPSLTKVNCNISININVNINANANVINLNSNNQKDQKYLNNEFNLLSLPLYLVEQYKRIVGKTLMVSGFLYLKLLFTYFT